MNWFIIFPITWYVIFMFIEWNLLISTSNYRIGKETLHIGDWIFLFIWPLKWLCVGLVYLTFLPGIIQDFTTKQIR